MPDLSFPSFPILPTHPNLRLFLLRLALLLALAPFLLLCAFNQPFFDDFRNGYWMREHGTWGVQLWLFQTWTGRFTTTFVMTVLNPVAYGWLGGVKVVAAAAFVAQWASLAYLLRTLLRTARQAACSRSQAFWAAGLLLAMFCNAAPGPFSFLYWFCGIVAYQLPLIGLLTFTALALRAGWGPAPTRWRNAGLACFPLVLALTGNELTLVQAGPVLALLGFTLPAAARPKLGLWLLIGAVAVGIAATAPGNWTRAAAMAPPAGPYHASRWLVLMPRAAYSMVLFLIKPMNGLSTLVAAAVGLWAGIITPRDPTHLQLTRRHWVAVLLAFGGLNFIGFLLFRFLRRGRAARAGSERNPARAAALNGRAGLAGGVAAAADNGFGLRAAAASSATSAAAAAAGPVRGRPRARSLARAGHQRRTLRCPDAGPLCRAAGGAPRGHAPGNPAAAAPTLRPGAHSAAPVQIGH